MNEKIREAINYVFQACCGHRKDESLNVKERYEELLALDLGRYSTDFPEEYMCPLSKELMTDPVKIFVPKKSFFEKGTYVNCDYDFMVRWLRENDVNPFSRTPLSLYELVPNHALKKEIYDYLESEISKVRNTYRNRSRPGM